MFKGTQAICDEVSFTHEGRVGDQEDLVLVALNRHYLVPQRVSFSSPLA